VGDKFAAQLSVAPRFCETCQRHTTQHSPVIPLANSAPEGKKPNRSCGGVCGRSNCLDSGFRRQYSIGPCFVDFICLEAKLIIEVDGSQHADEKQQDESRTAFLCAQGYRVHRFWNFEVIGQIDSVVERITAALEQTPSPKQQHEGMRRLRR
jgi:very-short-patch-repair endonuclease